MRGTACTVGGQLSAAHAWHGGTGDWAVLARQLGCFDWELSPMKLQLTEKKVPNMGPQLYFPVMRM